MPNEIFLIHPLGHAVAFVFGAFNLVSAWKRWCFSLTAHINIGVMFYALILIGSGAGMTLAQLGLRKNINLNSPVHNISAAVVIAVMLCGAMTGFMLLNKKNSGNRLTVIHRYCNCAVVVLFVAQFAFGVGPLAAVL